MTGRGPSQHAEAPRIPGHILVSRLGSGSHAEVWKAWRLGSKQWVAVKAFYRRGGFDWLFLEREVARLVKSEKHPNVAAIIDADLAAYVPWYSTDLLEGGSLERYLDPGSLVPVEVAVNWLEQACSALAFAHERGIIHCDVRPANILLDSRAHARLVDFGEARTFDGDAPLSALCYMAPEQALSPRHGAARPDVRWDVFGLGATAWALLTGSLPRGEQLRAALSAQIDVHDRLQLYRASAAVRPLPPLVDATSGRVGEDLSAVIEKCLATQPFERYSSIPELQADLQAVRDSRPVSPLAHSRGYRLKKMFHRLGAAAAWQTP